MASQKFQTDLDLDNVVRAINSPEPINNGDGVPKSYVFGADVEALAETSNTSPTVYARKVSLITPALPLGNYVLEWTFKWRVDNSNRGIDISILDNVTELINQIEFAGSATARSVNTGRKKLSNISGIKTFHLDFRTSGNTTAFISDVLLTIRRLPT
jgi:hypothetical protein